MIKVLLSIVILLSLTGCADSTGVQQSSSGTPSYVQANRYSGCFERLLESSEDSQSVMTFEEMDKVCSKYLE